MNPTKDVTKRVYAHVRMSEYEQTKRDIPDMFHNPNVIVRVIPDEFFDTMVEDIRKEDEEKNSG